MISAPLRQMHPNERLVRRFYEARARNDREAIRACLHPDVACHDSYPEPHGGDLRGVDAVFWSASLHGQSMQGREVAVFHVAAGLITEAWFYPEDPQAVGEFFG